MIVNLQHIRRGKHLLGVCIVISAAYGGARGGTYGIDSTAGDFQIVPAPPSVQRQDYESSTDMRVFEERQLSTSAIAVNAALPGVYHAYSDLVDQTITPAADVRSYFIHFDPVGTSTLVQLSGSVTFDEPILGVVARSLTMQDTDATLGSPTTAYPTNRFNRELEFETRGNYDYFQLMPDDHTIFVRAECSTDIDQIRIVTAAPEPGTMALLAGAMLWMWGRGKERPRRRS